MREREMPVLTQDQETLLFDMDDLLYGSEADLKIKVEKFAAKHGINCKNHLGQTLLMLALFDKKDSLFKEILVQGGDLTLADNRDTATRHYAKVGGEKVHAEIMRRL